jgi:hypothetical protein
MKDFQDAVKPFLVPMLDAVPCLITPYQQKLLAAWAAMCVMTGEYYAPDLVCVPFADREYLRLYREAPKDWKIWIGRYIRGKFRGYWVHNSVPLLKNIPKASDNTSYQPNTQTTTFIVGQVFIHAFRSAEPDITTRWRLDSLGPKILAQLWPVKEGFIAWPTNDISDRDAEGITGHIFWSLDGIARTFGF